MTDQIEISPRLEQWANLAGYTLTPASATNDGRPLFWSASGETRLFIARRREGWFVLTDSDRMESEGFVLAASSIDTIEKYLFGRFGRYIRSARGLPRVGVSTSANQQPPNFSIETRDFEGVERFALIDSDGSPVAISSADMITATSELKKLALYLAATTDQIEASALDSEGRPLFNPGKS
ncbi:TNT antitoxin family protein [Mycobacterium sp. 1465703.0]|uniref:TNT antitoxin family protein n=1 Tax=Mycobacterium sp. 1465703.0 TaxID=1834078 RepID=UPI0009F2E258|nr:TNT antitoxin family protein [Mycobacterium sp. 1465703.0]